MTAEITLLNKEAIAFAADSAVTISGESDYKTFSSANKLFSLSKYHPVGIMVYGNALFMGIPWETLIKVYRDFLGVKYFDFIEEYSQDFIDFLDKNELFTAEKQEEFFFETLYGYYDFIKESILDTVESLIDTFDEIDESQIKVVISKIIKEHFEKWNNANNNESLPKNFNSNLSKKFANDISETIKEIFQKLPISKSDKNKLRKIALYLFSKNIDDIESNNMSGVVIGGFGEKEIFPSMKSFHFEGVILNRLIYTDYISQKINYDKTAAIIPFAQNDMVYTFMEGINPTYQEIEINYLKKIFRDYADIIVDNTMKGKSKSKKENLKDTLWEIGEEVINDYVKQLEEYRKNEHIYPTTQIVSLLPKDELSSMAEALVNLTSFRRKISMGIETVGGPIDVAIISKGDGFVWIKRKHYFDPNFNPQFFANYYKIKEKE